MKENILVMFAKPPIAGQVKTRLGQEIGMDKAAEIYKAFLHDLINQHTNQEYDFAISTTALDQFALEEFTEEELLVIEQEGVDLGEKMCTTFKELCDKYERVLIIGSDLPHLTPSIAEEAFKSLDNKDIVIGPTVDGGYYLIGMKQPQEIFSNIEWSTEQVLKQTKERIEQNQLSVHFLAEQRDVDTREDLLASKPNITEHQVCTKKVLESQK